MTERHLCVVPGCRRTHKPAGFSEWICGRHWSLVSRSLRRRYAKARRRARRDPRWVPVVTRLWVRCREAAITETFMGVHL